MKREMTNGQVVLITRACILLNAFGGCLSDHEKRLIAEVGRRFRKDGRCVFVTGNEWPVIEAAVEAMEAVRSRQESDRPAEVAQ